MKYLLRSLGRLTVIGGLSLGLSTFINRHNHEGYWNGTIYRVQTTDFNLLSHTLPTKLSSVLIQGDRRELQRTLDSNYGLFGMVVTDCRSLIVDCPNQQILYSTNSSREWKERLGPATLINAPYSVLRNPPPLATESEFTSPREPEQKSTGRTNSGEIIGRVYYVRGIPPEFRVHYLKWLSKLPMSLFSDSESQKFYSLTFGLFSLGGLASFAGIEFVLYRRRVERRHTLMQQLHKQQENELILNDLERTRRDRRNLIDQVSSFRLHSQQQARELDSSRQQYHQLWHQSEHFRRQLEELLSREELPEEQHQVIDELRSKLDVSEQQRRNLEDLLSLLENQVQEAQQREQEAELRQEELQDTIGELRRTEQEAAEQLQSVETQIEEINPVPDHSSNDFEHQIFVSLQSSDRSQNGDWEMRDQFDAGQRNQPRQFADFIVVGRSCVFVIEAKYYKGVIQAEGDVRNVPWVCCDSNRSCRVINSCWGVNPYHQVARYTNSMLDRVTEVRTGGKVRVYGIVVFPEGANVKQFHRSIDRFYRVTTLERLTQVIKDLERNLTQRNQDQLSPLTPQQLMDVICGR